MKRISLIILFIASALTSKSQYNSSDKEAIQMLKEFYTAYIMAWDEWKPHTVPTVTIRKTDSLKQKYCTAKLKVDLKKLFKAEGLDHDLLINDEPTDMKHLKTLTVIKDPAKRNAYLVSYMDSNFTPTGKAIEKKNIIHVTVAKEAGRLKIASAYGDNIE
jgi:hypothetical protein